MTTDPRLARAAHYLETATLLMREPDPDWSGAGNWQDAAYDLLQRVRVERLSSTWRGRLALRLERWSCVPHAWDRRVWGLHWAVSNALQDSSHLYRWSWRLAFATVAKGLAGWVNFTLVWRTILREPTCLPAWQRATLDRVDQWTQGLWWDAMDCARGDCDHPGHGTFADTRSRRWWRLDALGTPLRALAKRLGGADFALPDPRAA